MLETREEFRGNVLAASKKSTLRRKPEFGTIERREEQIHFEHFKLRRGRLWFPLFTRRKLNLNRREVTPSHHGNQPRVFASSNYLYKQTLSISRNYYGFVFRWRRHKRELWGAVERQITLNHKVMRTVPTIRHIPPGGGISWIRYSQRIASVNLFRGVSR